MRYENDERAIARVIGEARKGAHSEIDHGTARAIAAGYNEPGVVEQFVSTGTIADGDALSLMKAIKGDVIVKYPDERDALTALCGYLVTREGAEDTGPVDGWSDMWVPKHVDYPHEDGALDTCWCFDADGGE